MGLQAKGGHQCGSARFLGMGPGTQPQCGLSQYCTLHVFWMKLGVPIITACPFLPHPPLGGFPHHVCLLAHFRCPEQAGLSPWTYLRFWILQVGFCRPWSTRRTPASPSSLVHRLSSVKVGLAWIAELMSLHRTSVTPQSSSLQTGPLGQHGAGLRSNYHLTQSTRSQEIQIWIIAIMFKLETGICGGRWCSVWARKLSQKTRTSAACLACTKPQH